MASRSRRYERTDSLQTTRSLWNTCTNHGLYFPCWNFQHKLLPRTGNIRRWLWCSSHRIGSHIDREEGASLNGLTESSTDDKNTRLRLRAVTAGLVAGIIASILAGALFAQGLVGYVIGFFVGASVGYTTTRAVSQSREGQP